VPRQIATDSAGTGWVSELIAVLGGVDIFGVVAQGLARKNVKIPDRAANGQRTPARSICR